MDELNKMVKESFGIDYIYPYQRLVIYNTLRSTGYFGEAEKLESISRQLVLLPTGAGKSLCFMFPATLLKGVTLIVFPLLSLMADQDRRIRERGYRSLILKGGISDREWREARDQVEKKGINFILTNPETLKGKKALDLLKSITISHIVIDEAHTLSEWGESFRPAYLEVGKMIKEFSCNCITAFTATASKRIINNIKKYLFNQEDINIVRGNPDRENIHYSTIPTISRNETLVDILRDIKSPTIIFHSSRVGCEVTGRFLSYRLGRDDIQYYHAGLSKKSKKEIEDWFYLSKSGILNATCAYGMGIDKSDIRTVIHYDSPVTVEAYLQESGRGGRDRKLARAIVIKDFKFEEDKPKSCRREELLDRLDYKIDNCSGCDICDGSAIEIPAGLRQILIFVKLNNTRFRLNKCCEILKGLYLGSKDYYGFGLLSKWDIDSIKEGIIELIKLKLLCQSNNPLYKKGIKITQEGVAVLRNLELNDNSLY